MEFASSRFLIRRSALQTWHDFWREMACCCDGECFETLAPGSWQIVPMDAGMSFADGLATLSVSKSGDSFAAAALT